MADPQGVAIAFDAAWDVVAPTWTRLDTPGQWNPIRSWSVERGRSYELDKSATGTARIMFRDTEGILDPTNATGPYYNKLDPLKQAAIALQNPVDSTWHTLFRGFVEEISAEVDVSEVYIDGEISLVDSLELFEAATVIPDNHNALIPGERDGESYYDVAGVDNRIRAILEDFGWPDAAPPTGLASIFSGNVEVQGCVYPPRTSLLSAIQDAADAEFPGVANFYVAKTGVVTFHGRYARFDYLNPDYGIQVWSCGDTATFEGDISIAPLFGLTFDRSKSHIYNVSTSTPTGIDDNAIAGQLVQDSTSINKYGHRAIDFENLITNASETPGGPTSPPDANAEVKKFSNYYVSNYKDPKNRIKQLIFKPVHTSHPNASALWSLMCEVELNDVIHVTTTHPGGGGFDEDFFVEGIHYEAEPMNDEYPLLTMTLDVSPASYYQVNPWA